MPIYRVTFGFSGVNVGWSETHAMNNQAVTALAALPAARAVAAQRAQFLGRDFSLAGIRVSIYSDGANPPTRVPRNPWLDKINYGNGGNQPGKAAEPKNVALQGIGIAAQAGVPVKFQGNKNTTFLGGPWDACVDDAGQVNKAALNLLPLFNAWKQVMIQNQFGWLNSVPLQASAISSVTQGVNGTVTFAIQPPIEQSLVAGKVYPIRVKGLNNGRSPLNGGFNARWAEPNTFTTLEQVAFVLDQVNGVLTPYQNVLGFIPYADLQLGDQTVGHKRGKPFLSERGRAPKRIRA